MAAYWSQADNITHQSPRNEPAKCNVYAIYVYTIYIQYTIYICIYNVYAIESQSQLIALKREQ